MQVDAPVRVAAEVLDRAAHDLRVADHRLDVVGRVDRGVEEPDHPHCSLDLARHHVVADLERPQHEDERAGGEVRQQAAPRRADGDAEAGHQRGERRRLDAEIAEDRDDQDDVERDGDVSSRRNGSRSARPSAARARLRDEVRREADQHPADDVGGDRARHLQRERDEQRLRGVDPVLDVHANALFTQCGGEQPEIVGGQLQPAIRESPAAARRSSAGAARRA